MICPKCAMEIREGSKFCSECGTVIKDLSAKNATENLSAPQVEDVLLADDETFFRVEKTATGEAPMPYDVVPKASRKPIAVPPKVTVDQVVINQQPKTPVEAGQVYTPTPTPISTTIVPPQAPSPPPQFQAVAIDHGVAAKKESPKKLMLFLGGVVVVLAAVVLILFLKLGKGGQVIKMDRHDGLSTASEQSKTSSGSGNQQQEASTPTITDIEESQEVDPAAEALKAKALKEEQLTQDKAAITNTMNLYYASFIESINVENSDNLVYSTDANKKIVDYKIENPNKGYLFIAKVIIYDLSSIEVVEDEVTGEKMATLSAKFAFEYRKKTETDDDWVNSDNFQKCYFVYDTDTESWLVDNTEIDSTIELGDNIELYTFE